MVLNQIAAVRRLFDKYSMQNRNFFLVLLSSSVALALFQIFGVIFYLYWRFWWFDIPIHFLGGFIMGLGVFAFFHRFHDLSFLPPRISKLRLLIFLFSAVLGIGILWELFELYDGLTSLEEPLYLADTVGDLLIDISGALFSWIFLSREYRESLI